MTPQDPHSKPSADYTTTRDVLDAETLSREEKIAILKQWEYDAREMEVAEEENMGGGADDKLGRVLKALDELRAGDPTHVASSSKQGGE